MIVSLKSFKFFLILLSIFFESFNQGFPQKKKKKTKKNKTKQNTEVSYWNSLAELIYLLDFFFFNTFWKCLFNNAWYMKLNLTNKKDHFFSVGMYKCHAHMFNYVNIDVLIFFKKKEQIKDKLNVQRN